MSIEDIYDSRRQVKVFDEFRIPKKSLIKSLLDKTHTLVPSKQNLMPYKVHILGPSCHKQKQILFDLSKENDPDDHHNTQILAPYVLIFTLRLAKANPAVQVRIDMDGHDYSMCDPERYKTENCELVGIEVGMFTTVLTALALEQEIDVSFMKCFPHWPPGKDKWKDLPFVDETPYLTMALGYRKDKEQPRHQGLKREDKPDVNEVINWI